MVFIDGSVVGVALPAIQASLAAPISQAQWIVNAYVLTLGTLVLIGGAAGDRFGRRRVCIAGIVLFTAASVWCGLAGSSSMLVAARAVQGVGGALLVPSSLAIISASFAPQQRARAIGTWAGASALTTALGPMLGGWLVDTLSWRAIFFVNVPLATIALLLAARWLAESRDESARGVDWIGSALAVAGLGLLAYGLTAASNVGWAQAAEVGTLCVSVLLLSALLWWEARAPAPMLPLILFRSLTFSGANAVTLLLYFALSGEMFFLPFYLIDIQGYSAAAAGATFLPFSLILAALSRWSGALNERFGARAADWRVAGERRGPGIVCAAVASGRLLEHGVSRHDGLGFRHDTVYCAADHGGHALGRQSLCRGGLRHQQCDCPHRRDAGGGAARRGGGGYIQERA